MSFSPFLSSPFSHTLRPLFHCYTLLLTYLTLYIYPCFPLYLLSTYLNFHCFTHLSAPLLLSLVGPQTDQEGQVPVGVIP